MDRVQGHDCHPFDYRWPEDVWVQMHDRRCVRFQGRKAYSFTTKLDRRINNCETSEFNLYDRRHPAEISFRP
jgi:hypothetical protein